MPFEVVWCRFSKKCFEMQLGSWSSPGGIISATKSIIPAHFPQSSVPQGHYTETGGLMLAVTFDAITTSTRQRTAHRFQGNDIYEPQTAIAFPLGTPDTKNNATNTQTGLLTGTDRCLFELLRCCVLGIE